MYIKDDNGVEFTVYGTYDATGETSYGSMTAKPVAGDLITVYGIIGSYSGAAQMKNGWITEHTVHTCAYENGACTLCGAADPDYVAPETGNLSVSKTHNDIATIAGVTAGQNTGIIANMDIALNDDITIVCAKASASTDPCIYTESIRLYQNGATLTVKAAEGCTMTTIVIHLASKSGGQGPITVTGGTASDLIDSAYTITVEAGVSEVVITTAGTDKNNRLYVDNITVNYTK